MLQQHQLVVVMWCCCVCLVLFVVRLFFLLPLLPIIRVGDAWRLSQHGRQGQADEEGEVGEREATL